jgi:uncharacterized protein (DUF488 family)
MLDKLAEVSPKEVLTIGYEGSDIQSFLDRLADAGVETIVDVRELPLSRKKGFSKNGLKEAAAGVGIDYVHLKSLGDPKEGRMAARAGDYGRFEQVFNAHMKSTTAQEGLKQLAGIIDGTKACLLCFEKNHESCHRHIVVDQLAQMKEISVRHIHV